MYQLEYTLNKINTPVFLEAMQACQELSEELSLILGRISNLNVEKNDAQMEVNFIKKTIADFSNVESSAKQLHGFAREIENLDIKIELLEAVKYNLGTRLLEIKEMQLAVKKEMKSVIEPYFKCLSEDNADATDVVASHLNDQYASLVFAFNKLLSDSGFFNIHNPKQKEYEGIVIGQMKISESDIIDNKGYKLKEALKEIR